MAGIPDLSSWRICDCGARDSGPAVMNRAPLAGATYPPLIMQCQQVEIRLAWS